MGDQQQLLRHLGEAGAPFLLRALLGDGEHGELAAGAVDRDGVAVVPDPEFARFGQEAAHGAAGPVQVRPVDRGEAAGGRKYHGVAIPVSYVFVSLVPRDVIGHRAEFVSGFGAAQRQGVVDAVVHVVDRADPLQQSPQLRGAGHGGHGLNYGLQTLVHAPLPASARRPGIATVEDARRE